MNANLDFRLLLIVQLMIFTVSGLEIIPNDTELTVTSGDNLTITCKHDGPVGWMHPDYDRQLEGSTLHEEYKKNEDETYVSHLTINRAFYQDTGYYSCIAKNTDQKVEIYLFVYDVVNLLAVNESVVILSQNEFGDVVIPCKPTFPDVNVTLSSDSGEEMENLNYDPKLGYIMKSPKVTDSGGVTCTATRGSLVKSQQFLITVNPVKTEVARPLINSNGVHGPLLEGSTVVLNCSVFVELGVTLFVSWISPNELTQLSGRTNVSQQFAVPFRGTSINYRVLTIRNVSRHDQGTYVCKVEDRHNNEANASFELITTGKDNTFLNISLQGRPEITVRTGTGKVQWIVNVVGYPEPKILWKDADEKEIINSAQSSKHQITYDKSVAKLVIQNLTIWDSGTYSLHAYNDGHRKSLNMTLLVEGRPNVLLHNSQPYYSVNQTYVVECTVTGIPLPSVVWMSKTCNQYPKCEQTNYELIDNGFDEITKNQHQLMSRYEFKSANTSMLMCLATNAFGSANDTSAFFVTDIRDGLELQGPKVVAVGDNVSLICGASLYCYEDDIVWYYRDFNKSEQTRIRNNITGITIASSKTKFSHRSVLTIINVDKSVTGEFTCEFRISNNATVNNSTTYQLYVHDVLSPVVIPDPSENKTSTGITEISTGKQVKFPCNIKGIPSPTVMWKKDGKLINPPDDTSSSRVVLVKDEDDPLIIKQTLKIRYTALNDDGAYTCFAFNRIGNVSVSRILALTDKSQEHAHTFFFLLCTVLVFAFVFCAIMLYLRCRKDRKLKKELAETGLLNFEEGAVSSLNPELGVEDQADLLPYDRRFEFARDKLKLGKQLGSGAFGVVMKAEADGIIDENTTATVAVKMVKRGADSLYIKALASELKIMIHLGRHLNVVNLLGACTRDIHKRELVVIVEYCRYGNLHDFLLKQRSNFINQINEKTGRIDPTIDALNNMIDYDSPPLMGNGRTTTSVEETPIGSDGYLLNKDNEPDWRSNYRGDYRNTFVKPISTTDLICWSFQIARGMDYLASRKVLHGDLAARNVLLADDNIVKICDFGLAKSMYNNENYQRRKHELLPVRWMAIESIRDRVFSIQSDVWSFAITLWELFSLSVTPYPGIEHLEVLYSKLVAGHRMERPMFATSDLYDIMLDCWRSRPTQRPTFTELTERLGSMLEDGVRSHYTKLNEMYLRMNTEMNNSVDYLALMNPPVYNAFETEPRYVNIPLNDNSHNADQEDDVELKPMLNNEGYTDMSRIRMQPVYANTPLTPTQV